MILPSRLELRKTMKTCTFLSVHGGFFAYGDTSSKNARHCDGIHLSCSYDVFPLSLSAPASKGAWSDQIAHAESRKSTPRVGDATGSRTLVLEQFDIARFDSDVRILEKCANPLHFYSQAKFSLWLAQPEVCSQTRDFFNNY